MSNKKETAGAVSWWMGMKLLPLEIEILSEFQVAGAVYDHQLFPQTFPCVGMDGVALLQAGGGAVRPAACGGADLPVILFSNQVGEVCPGLRIVAGEHHGIGAVVQDHLPLVPAVFQINVRKRLGEDADVGTVFAWK